MQVIIRPFLDTWGSTNPLHLPQTTFESAHVLPNQPSTSFLFAVIFKNSLVSFIAGSAVKGNTLVFLCQTRDNDVKCVALCRLDVQFEFMRYISSEQYLQKNKNKSCFIHVLLIWGSWGGCYCMETNRSQLHLSQTSHSFTLLNVFFLADLKSVPNAQPKLGEFFELAVQVWV